MRHPYRSNWMIGILASLLILSGCGKERVRLATTTSLENSGLLNLLLPPFEKRFDLKVDVIPVGTGNAFALAKRGDVDLVLVHAKEDEDEFVKRGFGVWKRKVMYNEFLIVGPVDDPAGIKGKRMAKEAMKRIAESKATFISRGDESGTHKKELSIWREAGIYPSGDWYLSTGQGMGVTLLIANEKKGYTLVDRGTYIAYKGKVDLIPLVEGDPMLLNPYSIIATNPSIHPHTNYKMAIALIEWITSKDGQDIIRGFSKEGQMLFHPVMED